MRQIAVVSSGFRLVLSLYYQNQPEIDAHCASGLYTPSHHFVAAGVRLRRRRFPVYKPNPRPPANLKTYTFLREGVVRASREFPFQDT